MSVATFKGSAGTSASGFKAEIEAARQLQQHEAIVDHYEHFYCGERVAGQGSARIRLLFEQVRRKLGPFQGTIADRHAVRAMPHNLARMLFAGIYNHCFFDPSVAVCLKGTRGDAPILSFCNPTQCRNSCITDRHKPAWERAIIRAEEIRRQPRLSTNQRDVLDTEIARMKRAIAPLEVHDGADT